MMTNSLNDKKLYFPWYTMLLTAWCVLVFSLWYSQSITIENKNIYGDIGAPYAIQIYQGQYWGVVTNSFIHISFIHIFINLLGLWLFGAYLERRMKFGRLFLLGLFASITTSLIQLTLSDDAGVGLGGVNCVLLAFIIGKGIYNERFKLRFRYKYLLILIGLIGVSVYLNKSYEYQIGVEALSSGIIIGFLLGILTELKSRVFAPAFVIIVISGGSFTLIKAPWSAEWNYYKGYESHLKYDFKSAKKHYQKSLQINPNHTVSRSNLHMIHIEELSDLALNAHEAEDYPMARFYYNKLLKVDPSNSWAKENAAKLP